MYNIYVYLYIMRKIHIQIYFQNFNIKVRKLERLSAEAFTELNFDDPWGQVRRKNNK